MEKKGQGLAITFIINQLFHITKEPDNKLSLQLMRWTKV